MSDEDFQHQLRNIKEAADAKKREEAAAVEAREAEAFQRRMVNGRAVQECIRKVIEPILEETRTQLSALGYTAEVEERLQRPAIHLPDWSVCAVEVVLRSTASPDAPASGRRVHRLEYRGGFEFQSIARTMVIRDRTVESTGAIALDAISTAVIKADVVRFFELAVA